MAGYQKIFVYFIRGVVILKRGIEFAGKGVGKNLFTNCDLQTILGEILMKKVVYTFHYIVTYIKFKTLSRIYPNLLYLFWTVAGIDR